MDARTKPRTVRRLGAVFALSAALVVTACSSSSKSASPAGNSGAAGSTAGASTGASGAEAAKKVVAQLSVPATQITAPAPLSPLKEKPPTGKNIVFIQPATLGEDAIKSGDELTAAAKLLGWTVKRLPAAGDVPSVQQAIEQALQLKPDGIMLWTGATTQELANQLNDAKSKNVPIWLGATDLPDTLPFPIIGGQGGNHTRARQSDAIAAFIASNSNCNKVHIGYINLRENAAVVTFGNDVKAAMLKYCPDAKYSNIDNGLSDIGQRLPANLVSAIQSDPSINYLVTSGGVFLSGVPAALRSAGLFDKVVITGTNPSAENLAATKSGEEPAWATVESSWFGWYAIDSFARYFTKSDLVNEAQAVDPLLILTKDNYKDSDGGSFFTKNGISRADLVSAFSKEWLLS